MPMGEVRAPFRRPRRGRPPSVEAGVVEERVLEAATDLFLEQGFGRTKLDQVATRAGTGKSALYGRYPDKEALFGAVVQRSIEAMFADLSPVPSNGPVRDRLRQVGLELVKNLLVPRCVSLMRITAAEAASFPGLARMAYQVSFDGSVRCVLAAMGGDAADPALATRTAERFVELAIQPISFQAAFGADIEILQLRSASDVEDAILLLEAKRQLPV